MKKNYGAAEIAEDIVGRVGPDIRLALPLGLGKPVTLVNALTGLVARRPDLHLSIFTALTLERPAPSDPLGSRFLEPALDRLFGAYPQVDYATWLREHRMPPNIEVHEFFLLAGRWLGIEDSQTRYVSANYTHALDVLTGARPNLVLQLVAPMANGFSLSCNPDITCDLLDMRRAGTLDFILAVETNAELPPMGGSALIETDEADFALAPDEPFELFSAVRQPVGDVEHAIGLHVSRTIPDGGTLQIGIGSLGDAVAHALLLRDACDLSDIWRACPFFLGERFRETGSFEIGLYAVTEMLVEGILRLFEAGVIRRKIGGASIHAAFFVETRDFYRRLREMPSDRRSGIAMEPVSFTNALYGEEDDKRNARTGARFVNAAMKATLLGAVASDATEDGQVVSGVGGQFNFVEQAFALKDARSILTLPATRTRRGRVESNIVWTYGHTTVPRHMRDIVVTEYGIADLRGKSDAEVIAAMVEIADSRFQEGLLAKARSAGKVSADYTIPERARSNTPDRLKQWVGPYRNGKLPEFPFGTDFTEAEQRLLPALGRLKEARGSLRALLPYLVAGLRRVSGTEAALLERMGLSRPSGIRDLAMAVLVRGALRRCPR
ncbi:acetyl-CoA hydrolase/transferase C-terminal domain-containing protein [Ruegeria marina]|uniref:Acetyl-CoA hydrolase/transferase C-terminal domain-containing protein n=1 Tax=Ruegeria marina TaxID=639004 RepID=A0A1G6UX47_9RHOB|nr:acetyl-CoA hydrolase/transferase C-terminal domain-containing protein [Ruegeria marina]SDD45821.1 Acetyl-CoA hydrolase/transferase C-terminal domain-containing protein [Ruegeria marina]